MKRTSALFFAILFVVTAYSQNKLWDVDLKEALYEVGWIKQSNEGFIIASGAKGLLAMNNENGETVWHNKEFKAVDKNSFMTIDGLPIIYFEYAPVVGKVRGILMNSSNGEVLFDTKDDGYRIKDFTLIPDQGIILFELLKDNERNLMSFSLKTWKKEWIAVVGESKGLLNKYSKVSYIDHGPFFTNENNLVIGIKDEIYAINLNNGEITWKFKADKKINALVFSEANNSLYVGVKKSNKLKVLNPNSGEDITPGKLKLKGTLVDVRADKDENLILVETEGFNIIDLKTNNFKWKKSFKIDFLEEVIPTEKGYIAVGKNEKEGSVALVDMEGDKLWQSKIKGYSYYVTPTANGVLYISTERSNILDFEKGKDVWDRDVKFKAIPAVTYDKKEDKVILFENKKAYKFDLTTGQIDLFAEDVVLDNVKKKTPLLAEYIENAGYLLNTDQHVSLLSPSGKIIYTKYFEPASDLGGFKNAAQLGLMIAGVDFDIEGSLDNIKMLSSLSNGAYRTSSDQTDGTSETNVVGGLYLETTDGNMAPVIEITKTRYSNSKSIKSHKFIVTKVKDETEGIKHFIDKVNKVTGEVDVQIELMDKTPDYVIDEVENVVLVNENNHLISAYKF
ncbi:hypothetical protein GQR60_18070 [Labilibaculum sp. A4]|uniref:hypothetical protein n=1 Tax=Labilibaculum euxinus TaxID=2686357 RepID=UPI000F6206BF|nr:hypothetical protein [Labilibaculum euxinus]MDQ1772469.1 hypothetical protein [Labilibaculum euxinus]MWN78246.1 hypothetical protein [Labilibaculum euxinus]